EVREAAFWTLRRMGPKTTPALLTMLKEENADARRDAVKALALIRPVAKETVPALLAALKDRDVKGRAAAATALADVGPEGEEAARAVIASLKDRELWETVVFGRPASEHVSVRALQRLGAAAVPGLIAALKDEDTVVRWQAALALGLIGPEAKEAVPALRAAL